jgi:hypothetical protein
MDTIQLAGSIDVLLDLIKVLGDEHVLGEPGHVTGFRDCLLNAYEVVVPSNAAQKDVEDIMMGDLQHLLC